MSRTITNAGSVHAAPVRHHAQSTTRAVVATRTFNGFRSEWTSVEPLSARQTYLRAHQLFQDLAVPRRRAQVDLSLAVVEEMCGRLDHAASSYELLADDARLSPRDRTRALLWVGTALSKRGNNTYAVVVMDQAIKRFEELEEPGDWSVAHQKMALATAARAA